ncbi:MAG: Terephthalate 1,2-dioxygenase, reductase component 1 [Candidatus Accumulibacter appositus]|uniref:Terephthalate 1,2-dioxygenase, reductase component 1 n=1 Tax=Candidatus Accumulibacter appositus TaxID=1454003 RepID=A0A011NWY6_9PROT|nr:MAG: Terephthalate 1,2-dioxygenase, reductase component 1 [Candidatus Accumulibacter appositus]
MLSCCATALEDVIIEYQASAASSRIPEYTARVVKMEKLTHDVMRVLLKLPEGQTIAFKAGQYVNIILDDGQRRAFSFANPPHEPEFVELQIRLMTGGKFTTHVFEKMKEGDEVRFEGPIGDFSLRESERPIVLNPSARSSSSPAPPASRRSRAWSKTPSSAASSARSTSTGASGP